jgi:hypothetical protein
MGILLPFQELRAVNTEDAHNLVTSPLTQIEFKSFPDKVVVAILVNKVHSNFHITTLDYMTTLAIRHISGQPNFLVLICLHTTTRTLVIRHFLGPICHIIEVINVYKWWDPLVFQGSYVTSTSGTCRGTFGNQFFNLYYGFLS